MFMTPPSPTNESERLAALRACEVLDTPPEVAFDELARAAALICNAPIALVSLIDESRQWFKSRIGLAATETPREVSFCGHAILQPDLFVIPDARRDARFVDNPLVTGEPHIRFYAAMPVITPEGHALGTLCVIDRVARDLAPEQAALLRCLGNQVASQLQLRRSVHELRCANERFRETEQALQGSNRMLGALRAALLEFVGTTDAAVVFDGLLTNLLALTQSEYGFIGEVLFDGAGEPYLRTHALSNIAWNAETRALYERHAPNLEFRNLKTLFGAALTTGEAVLANDPQTDPRSGGRPAGHPPLRSFMGVPFHHGHELVGMVGIANRAGGYDRALLSYLEPFLVTCAYIVEAYRTDQRRKIAEEALRRRSDELSAANAALGHAARAKDEFLASMSHELRTPLTAVLGISESLRNQMQGPLTPRQIKALGHVEESGQHLLTLINDVLDLSKIEAGQLELELGPVAADDVSRASLALVRQLARTKKLSVEYASRPADILLVADARRLKQILVNLLSNAVKFTPAGGSVGLQVVGDAEAAIVRFTVWDTGIGIAEHDLPTLFRPFAQIDSGLNREYTGSGLGLSLVHRMVELHRGGVSVESTVGQGSRFTIALPWTAPADSEGSDAAEQSAPAAARPLPRELNGALMSRHLTLLGIPNVLHTRAEGVQRLIATLRPSLLVLDVDLPDRSGWDVMEELERSAATAPVPVLLITEADDEERAKRMGAAGHLTKPFSLTRLQPLLQTLRNESAAPSGPVLLVAPHGPGDKRLILLAEDNELTISLYSDWLAAMGYELVVARDGREAVQFAREFHPELILMDVQMPNVDGLQATRTLRADTDPRVARVPIIALTALAMTGDRERCLAAGANAYLTKPVGLETLRRHIAATLEHPGETRG